jgi:hypothetical protein
MKISIKRKAMKDLIKQLESCIKNKTGILVEDTLSLNTVSYVDIEMEEGEEIFKKNNQIYTKSHLKKSNWYN